jgi:putative redox protein
VLLRDARASAKQHFSNGGETMTIRVVRDQQAPLRHEIRIGPNSISTDLARELGGEGSGPSPHDLYDAALGACKALTILLYAKRKKIPVEGIEVSVERDASQEHAGIYRLSTALTLTGDLSTAQREELVRVAHKCPIQRLMTEVTTEISTTLSLPGQT